MNHAFGIKGSVRKLEQRKHHKQNAIADLAHLRDFHSYDLEFSRSGQLLQETSYKLGGSFDCITRFDYNELGKIIHTEQFDGKGRRDGSSQFIYSDSKCIWVNRDSQDVITSNGIDQYQDSLLLSASTFNAEDKLRRLKTFEYSNQKLLKSKSQYYLPDGTANECWHTEYDSEGRIFLTFCLKEDGSPLGNGKYLYEYDSDGRESKVWTFSEFGDDKTATSLAMYKYINDDAGNWIERHECHMWRADSRQSRSLTTRTIAYFEKDER